MGVRRSVAVAFSDSIMQWISDIKKSQGKLARTVDTLDEGVVCRKRKSLKPAKNERLDQTLYVWLSRKEL